MVSARFQGQGGGAGEGIVVKTKGTDNLGCLAGIGCAAGPSAAGSNGLLRNDPCEPGVGLCRPVVGWCCVENDTLGLGRAVKNPGTGDARPGGIKGKVGKFHAADRRGFAPKIVLDTGRHSRVEQIKKSHDFWSDSDRRSRSRTSPNVLESIH